MPPSNSIAKPPSSGFRWTIRLLVIMVVVPCAYGFATRFYEFLQTFRASPDGAFAIVPMVNYLAATAGFTALLVWAAAHGMFRDVEAPKHEFLAREEWLDRGGDAAGDDAPDEDGSDDAPDGWRDLDDGDAVAVRDKELIHG